MDVTQARILRRMADELSRLSADAAAAADAEVWRLTRAEKAAVVAKAMGVTVWTVNKAVKQHNARVKATQE